MITLTEFTKEVNVKGHSRLRTSKKGTKSYAVKDYKRKLKDNTKTIAAAIGLPVVTYLAIKGRYRVGMKRTLNNAIKKADNIILDIPNDIKSTTFGMPGFTGIPNSKITTEKLGYILEKSKPNTKVFMLENKKFNVNNPLDYSEKGWGKKQLIEMPKTVFRTLVKQANNPEVENMLAHAIAAKKQRPDININLFGVSAGGNVVQEVSEHLTTLGIKHKGITIGTGYYGLANPSKTIKNYTNLLDPYTALVPKFNTTYTKSGKGHNIKEYLKDPIIRKEINDYFD